ncbi:C40 family peptidase [Niallia endozanthoxylica]|uniref:LysM peptidoglycan-binding domain-containing protein n=1 Tax=Niallia endozanthoxylica TaxID=2036016 RepID=A0A5J5I3E3_9BACI|nr:C40 family peptidase [Niallia endozanthoxylica]KAA9029456.1 LysM peptidoglycan-binding domain-containing protein [Niallia endozanthoxylica]
MKKQLFVMAASVGILFSAYSTQASAHELNYTVQSSDTLWRISSANHVSVQDLMNWNNLTSNRVYVGQKLSLIAPHTHTPHGTYTVKPGDNLSLIARNYNTTVTELKSINQLTSDILKVGHVLKVPNSESVNKTAPVVEKSVKEYTVKSSDTLYSIAKWNNLTVPQLKSINNLTSNNIYVGQVLKLTSEGKTAPASAPMVESTFNVDRLITEAKKYIGVPYLWGGTTPASFDCSGFLNYVYNKQGISLPRTVESMWSAATSVSTPQKGDLVFFTTYKTGPSHTGIYMGDNLFIHAGSSTGVTISDMNSPYWKERYLGAKKVKM